MTEAEAARRRGGRPTKTGHPGTALARKWAPVFLEKLSELGVVSHAAAAAGVSRQVVYRAREADPDFAEA